MKLGSHDTMTYKMPTKWYLWPIMFTARCQSCNWTKQYKKGARLFDVRLKYDDNGKLYYGHGIFKYDASDFDEFLEFMNNRLDTVYVRLLFEERSYDLKDKKRDFKIGLFVAKCEEIEQKYNNIKFCSGQSLWTGEELYHFQNEMPPTQHCYSSQTSLFKSDNKILRAIDDWCPWIYARLNTKIKWLEYEPKEGYVLLDFINIL